MRLGKGLWKADREKTCDTKAPEGQDAVAHFGFKEIPEDEKVSWVVRHFNTVAHKYDFMNTLLSFGIHHLWKRTSIRIMGLKTGDHLIDVCGGTGDLSLLAAKVVGPSGKIVLYDMNRAMMERGRPKVEKSPFPELISLVQGDAERISFPDSCFDAATVGFGVRNLTHLEQGLREMHRVLKPGGKFMCLEFSEPVSPAFRWLYDFYSFYMMPFIGQLIGGSKQAYTYLPESIRLFPSPSELADMLRRIGFCNVTFKRLTNGIAVIHVATKA
jgi:demethylmenaquinone methyltransferase / 2-methoxy-6-polyprenyl-1,4-benzoquinol methylase